MALPKRSYYTCTHCVKLVTVFLILVSLMFVVPSKPDRVVFEDDDVEGLKERKQMLGSRPPMCINKCSKCRPCKATLVIPPHRKGSFKTSPSLEQQDDTYYLLTWKCRCGNKIYQP